MFHAYLVSDQRAGLFAAPQHGPGDEGGGRVEHPCGDDLGRGTRGRPGVRPHHLQLRGQPHHGPVEGLHEHLRDG